MLCEGCAWPSRAAGAGATHGHLDDGEVPRSISSWEVGQGSRSGHAGAGNELLVLQISLACLTCSGGCPGSGRAHSGPEASFWVKQSLARIDS